MGRVPLQEGEDTQNFLSPECTEERSQEHRARRWPPTSRKHRSQNETYFAIILMLDLLASEFGEINLYRLSHPI